MEILEWVIQQVLASLDGKTFSEGNKCQESNIGDSHNTGDGGKIAGGAIGACSGGIAEANLVYYFIVQQS
nr:hypothetical protein [Tanacetum cinerariifolium]